MKIKIEIRSLQVRGPRGLTVDMYIERKDGDRYPSASRDFWLDDTLAENRERANFWIEDNFRRWGFYETGLKR
jgi:hypothetical protein